MTEQPLTRIEKLKKCANDLTYFGITISPQTYYLDPPAFHSELDSLLTDRSIIQLLIEAPRGTAKSSKAIAGILDHAIFDEGDKFIIIQSKTRPEAINRLTKIKDILSYSKEFRELFGYCGEQVAEVWREDKIRVKIGKWYVTIKALGTGQQIRGALEGDTRITLLCHAKGSLVWYNGRLIPIEHTDWLHLAERIDKTKEIEVYGNPIKESVTFEHRVWAKEKLRWYSKDRNRHYKLSDPKWVEAKDITKTNFWIGEPIDYSDSKLESIEVWKNKLPLGLGYYKKEIPEYFNDPEFWWAYGLWLGDGHTTKTMVGWSCANKYPLIKERLLNFISKYGKPQRTMQIGCETILWCKTELSKWLKQQHEGNAIKIPPTWVRTLPEKYLRNIIRGLIDSDGHVDDKTERPKIRITSVNLEGLLIIQKMLAKLNIPSWVRATTKPRWENFPNGYTSYSRQKYDIYFRNNVEQLGIKLKSSTRYNLNSVFIEDGYLWKQVKDINDSGSKIIHPVTTPDHTYLSPMGKNHNCLDDPDDENNCVTKEQMDKNFDSFLGGLAGLDRRNGRVIVIGTPIRQGCIVERLRGATGWVTKHYQSYNEETKEVLWKEMYSYEWLMNKKKELEELGKISKFYSEYQCEIMGDEDRLFKKEYLRWYDGCLIFKEGFPYLKMTHEGETEHDIRELMEARLIPVNTFLGVDPASSTKSSADYSVTFPVLYDGIYIYADDYFRKRVAPTAHAEQIIDKIKTIQPTRAFTESVGYQEMLRDYLRKRLAEENLFVSGLETKITPRTEKSARLERLHPMFFNRRVYVKKNMTEFVDELMMYPRARHDDLMDGFDLATRKLVKPDHTIEKKEVEHFKPLIRKVNTHSNEYLWMN